MTNAPPGTPADTRGLVPTLDGPIANTPDSHQFNSTLTYDAPLDLTRFGFVEEEFFVAGRSAVYADDLAVLHEGLWRRGWDYYLDHWCVPGTGHTEVTSPVMPSNTEVVRAGRKPRQMTPCLLYTSDAADE